ncbi:hypothetical protein U5801_00025 [Lamprobacter modestohalophilus]|uniref:hypothetical protein n=1 Tax=Lamprobacter modestohalophilus TaxID=1064514 RepID=UPI002ADEE7D7|nr:hypothetical protein [Lamprobacter modestohalophilus]MEA1048209.1 hypothetical protein [Lamprobacter modestohalophilus]
MFAPNEAEGLKHDLPTRARARSRRNQRFCRALSAPTKRFGEPSESIHQRLETADAETLALWFDRALEARALEDIFYD